MRDATHGPRSNRWVFWLLTAGLATAATLVVMLGVRVDDMERRIGDLHRAGWFPEVGMYVPAFTAGDERGAELYVGGSQDGSPQLLIVMSFACEFSERSRPAWRALSEANRGARIVGISVDEEADVSEHIASDGMGFPIVTFPEPKLHWFYRTGVTPQLMILSHDGRVIYHRVGELSVGPALDSIQARLDAATLE